MFKFVSIALILVTALTLGAAWILGDDFRPWVRTLKDDRKSDLEQLVDSHRLQLHKAEHALEKASRQANEAERSLAATNAALVRLESDLRKARREAEDAKTILNELKQNSERGQTIVAGDGRVLSPQESQLRIADLTHQASLAEQRITMLEDLLRRHRERKERLEVVVREAPGELARLELSVRHLGEKVRLYEEYRELVPETGGGKDAFAEARRTLEAAHAEVDARLKVVEGRMGAVSEAVSNTNVGLLGRESSR
jgi:chromosome segregation ATPase